MRETVMCISTNMMLLRWNRHTREVYLIQSGSLGGRFQEEFQLFESWKLNAQTQGKWSAVRYKVFGGWEWMMLWWEMWLTCSKSWGGEAGDQCRIMSYLCKKRNSGMRRSLQTIPNLLCHCPTSFHWALGGCSLNIPFAMSYSHSAKSHFMNADFKCWKKTEK